MHASAVEHSADKGISFEVPSINFENNDNFVHISKKDLHEVIKPHLENIFKWTKSVINNSGYSNIISRQLVMTGGGSQLDGLVILAKDYLDYNSRIGLPREFKINLESPLNPSHSVALGIIQSVFKANEEEKVFTDEVSAMLHYYKKDISIYPCNKTNIKVTKKEDLETVEQYLKLAGRI